LNTQSVITVVNPLDKRIPESSKSTFPSSSNIHPSARNECYPLLVPSNVIP
jgi:hypothetical protein